MYYPSQAAIAAVPFAIVQLLAGLTAANASEGSAENAGNRYLKCGQPLLQATAPIKIEHIAGFGIVLDGEPYYFIIQERGRFTVKSTKDGLPVADVLVDRPSANVFAEQTNWRGRYMEDVAYRTGVKLEQQELGGGLTVMTANKPAPEGQFVGISLLVDPVRKVMLQWSWSAANRYSRVNDVQALQSSIWKTLSACLAEK